jgi:ferredoxin
MEAELQTHVAFHLTGRRPAAGLDAVDALELSPALFARYRDLSLLRYDFPLVLVRNAAAAPCAQPLSGLLDRVLQEIGVGDDGERVSRHVLRLEMQIRALVADGVRGSLASLWDSAADRLAVRTDELLGDSLKRARSALKIDGDVVDCDAAMPAALFTHAWRVIQERKAKKLAGTISRLAVKLSEILRSDFVRSDAGRTADSLKAAIGDAHGAIFDFTAMSRLLTKAAPKAAMPAKRRQRIEGLLSVLESQAFVPMPDATGKRTPAYTFAFDSCSAAVAAYRERYPKVTELAKALAVAELEIKGEYKDASHDDYFAGYGSDGLDPEELALFPDYLVCVNASALDAVESATLLELLSAGLPVKVMVQTDDILEESQLGDGHLSFGTKSRQLANMAIGLHEVFVLQSAASNLVQMRERIERGLAYAGPALFSVFSGATATAADLPPYLIAAAAMESRAFPAFTFDPSAGTDWASRFDLSTNPQIDRDWPLHDFTYETAEHQRGGEEVAFTLVHFVACDRRYMRHFARVPRSDWNAKMVPVGESLAREQKGLPESIPTLLMVDAANVVQKALVDDKVMREARRCRDMWHSLQELGGVNNSHAERLLARERKAQDEREKAIAEARGVEPASQPGAAAAAPAAASPAAEAAPEPSRDEAYIETARCTTCNECTKINDRMFAYNDNQQAYIKDPDAGTYAQLVEAAESCQVSIIHPGKPRNPDEPGVAELLQRAESFR